MRLRRLTNDELFLLYESDLSLRHRSTDALEEAKRVLSHFKEFLGSFPPTPELAVSYVSQFARHEPTTLYRYNSVLKVVMAWYGKKLDTKLPEPAYGPCQH